MRLLILLLNIYTVYAEVCLGTQRTQDTFVRMMSAKYGGDTCTSPTDCETKCTTGCDGYSQIPSGTVVLQVSRGSGFGCSLSSDGVVNCWGKNNYGQCGDGTTTSRTTPGIVTLESAAVGMECGTQHVCALLDTGKVQCWGRNHVGQLGIGSTTNKYTAQTVLNIEGVTQLTTAGYRNCVLFGTGEVKCWGYNYYGQLGIGSTANQGDGAGEMAGLSFTDVDGAVRHIACGGHTNGGHCCAIMMNNDLKCWGYNNVGQLGIGSTTAAGNVANTMGSNLQVTMSNVLKVSLGESTTCAITTGFTLHCWGREGFTGYDDTTRRTTPGPPLLLGKTPVDITLGHYRTACALFEDGSAKCWGMGWYGMLGQGVSDGNQGDAAGEMAALSFIDLSGTGSEAWSICAGSSMTCAVIDGKVACWGLSNTGQAGGSTCNYECYEPEGNIDYGYGAVTYTYAYGSKQNALGLSKELTDICAPCVANEYIQQRYESGSYTVEAGQTSYSCTTLAACEPQCSGDANCVGYTEDQGLEAVAFGRGSAFHQSILFSDGSVRCWATDGYGDRCGTDDDSTHYNINDPSTWGLTKLSGPAIAVADVEYGGCALMQDGSLECWMDYSMGWFVFVNPGTSGKVGNDATNPMETHRALDTGSYRFKNISSSDSGMCGILKGADEGKVACFGYFGYTGGPGAGYSSPTHATKPLPIMDFGSPAKDLSCGDDHCCFLLDDNSIKCFGANYYGQLGIGSTTVVEFPNMLASVDIGTHIPAKIYCERKSTHVITTTGDLIGWGGNEQHELGYNDADYAFGNKQGDAAGEMGANLIVTMTNVRDMGGRVCNINALVTNDDIMYTTTNVAQTPSWVQRATNVNFVGTNGGCYGPKYFYVKNDGMFGGKDTGENPAYATLNMKNMGFTCITCAGGTYNRPGDTTTGTCDDDETCNANFYSDGTQCVACPFGTTSVGAAVIDGNSYCKRNGPCGVDEYVNEDSVCAICPFGGFSDATATEYTATPCLKPAATCGENEHSSIQYVDADTRYFGNTCTNCETDCTNDATCLGYTPGNKIVSIAGYYHFGCSASSQGVKCWGKNTNGVLGIGSSDATLQVTSAEATNIPLQGVVKIRSPRFQSSNIHAVWAIFEDGSVRSWGNDFKYRLGYEVSGNRNEPGPPIETHGGEVKDMCGGYGYSCMLLKDGRVFCWGGYSYSYPSGWETPSTVKNTASLPALDFGGTASAITCSELHACVVIDEKVKCWTNRQDYGVIGGNSLTGYKTVTPSLPYVLGLTKPVVDIATTYKSTCALYNDGTVKCWGLNSDGQGGTNTYGVSGGAPTATIGDAAGEMEAAPEADITGVIKIEGGYNHFCAVVTGGGLICWGRNAANGATGYKTAAGNNGIPSAYTTFLPSVDLSPELGTVVDVTTGHYWSCAILDTGNAKCFGDNKNGERGDSDTADRDVTEATDLYSSVYDDSYGAMTSSGKGYAKRSQCGACPVNTTRPAGDSLSGATWCISQTTCGKDEFMNTNYECQACAEGVFNNPGDNSPGICNDQAVCTENQHVSGGMCLSCPANTTNPAGDDTNNGNSYCTLDIPCAQNEYVNNQHQCVSCPPGAYNDVGDTTTGTCDDTEKCNDGYHVKTTFASDNTKKYGSTPCDNATDCETKCTANATCAGYTSSHKKTIAIGYQAICTLKTDGTVRCWGKNGNGDIGVGDTDPKTLNDHPQGVQMNGVTSASWVAIGHGSQQTCVIDSGTVKCTGSNGNGQVGDGTTVARTTVISNGITTAVQVETGNSFSCALLADGEVKCWGWNVVGMIGDGSTTDRHSPVSTGITNAVQISCGDTHSCALLSDKTVKCWGDNGKGQLGDGTNTQRNTPVSVSNLNNVKQVSCGGRTTCALLEDGTATCWGYNGNGRLGDGTADDTNAPGTAIALGDTATKIVTAEGKTCALLTGGIKCWGTGYNGYGDQIDRLLPDALYINVGTVVDVDVYGSFVVALLDDDSIKVWGTAYGGYYHNAGLGSWLVNPTLVTGTAMQPFERQYGPQIAGTATSFVKAKGCQFCPAGYNNEAMDDPLLDDTTCDFIPCAQDQKVVSGSCSACVLGSTRPAGDADPLIDNYCFCGINQHVVDKVCTECPTGGTRPAGDDESGANTECLIAPCAKDYHVVSGACVACPTGLTNDAGDTNELGDTFCDANFVCLENQYVSSNQCEDCTVGTAPYGGDPGGPDTVCVCGTNEYSDGAACQTCGYGTFNDAGSPVDQVGTCDGVDVCETDEHVSLKFVLYAGQQISNGAGYSSPYTDLEKAKRMCVADQACKGLTKDGTNYYLSDGTMSANAVYDAYLIHRDEYMCAPCGGTGSRVAGDVADAVTSCSFTTCATEEGVEDFVCTACTGGNIQPTPLNPVVGNQACYTPPCLENEYASGVCVACPTDATNVAGDLPDDGDTICDFGTCGKDEYVSSHACVSCATGFNDPGDWRGADSICDDIELCDANEYALEGACISCPGVGTNPAARVNESTVCTFPDCQTDQYSVGDGVCLACQTGRTMPTPVNPTEASKCLCATGERAVNGSCVTCPAGFTNVAGDSTCDICYDTGCDFIPCAKDHYVVGTGYDRVCTQCAGGTYSGGGNVTECGAVQYCEATERSSSSFASDTNKYGGTACSDATDCHTKCSVDAECSGYTIIPPYTSWSEDSSIGTAKAWQSVASSADGTKLAAVPYNGNIYTSTDSGATWTPVATAEQWYGIASSSNGTKLAAAAKSGNIYTSTDSGATWTSVATVQNWYDIASSADGTKLVAVSNGENIWTSSDSGATWTERVVGSSEAWTRVASSDDGSKLAATVYNGNIWVSTDSGATWTEDTSVGSTEAWYSIASSSDGTKMVAAAYGDYIYISSDSGSTWVKGSLHGNWYGIAMSADGSTIVASKEGGNTWVTTDGTTWTEDTSVGATKSWNSLAISADGSKLFGSVSSENLWTGEIVIYKEYGPTVAGTVDSEGKTSSCIACATGYENDDGITAKGGPDGTCIARTCSDNEYSDGSICLACPQYTGAVSVGLNPTLGETQCVATTCQTDEHVVNNVCTACDSDSYRLAGDQIYGGDTHCFCKDNQKVIDKACVACETGSSNPNMCYSGLQNHYCVCHENYHVVSNVCTACPAGATRTAGDYAGNADTHCFCGENQRVVNNECVACPVGTNKPAGDDSSGPDTGCSCVENEHVFIGYVTDTNKYEGTTCDDALDCETKCTLDNTCGGYTIGSQGQSLGRGGEFVCAVLSGGTKCWGRNSWDIFNNGAGNVGDAANEMGANLPYLLSDVKKISGGGTSSVLCALLTSGVLECWGQSSYKTHGQSGTGAISFANRATAASGVSDWAMGTNVACAVMNSGAVKCWGVNTFGQLGDGTISSNSLPTDVLNINNAIGVGVAMESSCALLTDGTVQCWGRQDKIGRATTADDPTPGDVGVTGAIQIDANHYYTCVVLNDGTIKCWGVPSHEVFGDGGTSVGYGAGKHTVSNIGDTLPSAVKISVGNDHMCAVLDNGHLYCWGENAYGQVGDGTSTDRNTPVKIMEGVSSVICAHRVTCARLDDDSVKCWGRNKYGEVGQGDTTENRQSPLSVDLADTFPPTSITYGPLVAGTGDSEALQKECQACPTGSIRTAGDLVADGATSCACPENHHVVVGECQACVGGIRAAGDDPAVDTHCLCLEDQRVQDNVCTTCPTGEEKLAGDDAGGNNTACSCKQNYYATGSGCAECTTGAIIGAGSDPLVATVCTCSEGYEPNGAVCDACAATEQSGLNTSCICKENHHYDGSACVACPVGSIRAGGDPKENVTVCEAVICVENQRVLNNECVNCLPGKIKTAGDEASGIDTVCTFQGTSHVVSTAGLYAFRIDTLPNNGEMTIRAGETHTFYRASSGDPFRIVSEADCEGKECNKAQYTTLPSSSLGIGDAEDEVAVTVFTPDTAGVYYYLSTETPYRKGRIVVEWSLCTITYPITNLSTSCELSAEETLTGDLSIQYVTQGLRAQAGDVPQIKAAEGARHFTVSGGFKLSLNDVDLNGGRGTEGGSILIDNGEIDANNVKFTDNVASLQGGAIRVKNAASKVSLSNILFEDNQGTEGGAIATDALTEPVEIHASDFKANTAASGDGGAIKTDTVINITGTNFEANLANSGEGGGISTTKDLSLSGSSFKSNKALSGGALKSEDNTVTMSNMVVEANEAVEDGGAFLAKNSEFDVRTSTILANKAKRGAAFKTSFTGCTTNCKKLRIRSSSIEDNEATLDGGAIDFDADADAEPQFWIQDTEMKNNIARGQANDFKRRGSKVKIKAIDSDIGTIEGGGVDKVCETGQCSGRAESTCEVTATGTECACDGTTKHLSTEECKVHKVCTGLGLDVEIRAPDKKHDRLCGTQDIADLAYKLDDKGKELAELIETKLVAEGVAADQAYALAVEVFGEINKCN